MPTTPGLELQVRGLTKRFGSFTAVEDLSFTAQPGRVTGFLGPNGSGKTTTMRILLGLVRATAGQALIGGQTYRSLKSPLTVVGAALEATDFHPARTGRDHLRVVAATHGIGERRVDDLLDLVGIPAAARKRTAGYSMGMRQRLALATALLGDPAVLLLDEPANGLDPEGIRWVRGFTRFLASEGRTVLISSHQLAEMEQTADDVVIINNGRLITASTIEELRGTPTCVIETSDIDALAAALRVADVITHPEPSGSLIAETGDLRLVGDVALRAGLPIWRLESRHTDLEESFFAMTEGPNRNELHRSEASA
ncbi:ATP-binding cassette domain-containing protein [Kribbia dieselivorans]|uniref:ATP-binding cassette domain-containing protein n=1 Tax=Kribbia dieselivorans TaxID=331526 RepID=UPI0008393420|nr:ATP-binding cassette domain-containing protein [Kribbia dieselivorans]